MHRAEIKKIIAIFFLVGIVSFFYLKATEKLLKKEIFNNLGAICASKKEAILSVIEDNKKTISSIAVQLILIKRLKGLKNDKINYDGILNEINKNILNVKFFRHDLDEICIINSDGKIIVGTNNKDIGKDMSESDLYSKGNKGYYQSNLFFEKKVLFYWISEKIFDENNKEFLGVICAKVNPYRIVNIVNDYSGLGSSGGIFIGRMSDNEQEIILLTLSPLVKEKALQITVPVNSPYTKTMGYALKGNEGVEVDLNYKGKKTVSAYRYIAGQKWGVVVDSNYSEVFRPIFSLRLKAIIFIVFMYLFFFGVINVIFANKRTSKEMQDGDRNLKDILWFSQSMCPLLKTDDLFSVILRNATEILKADGGIIALVENNENEDKSNKQLVFPSHINLSESLVQEITSKSLELSEYVGKIKTDGFLHIANYAKFDKKDFSWFNDENIKSIFLMTLIVKTDEFIGFLMFFNFDSKNKFTEKHINKFVNSKNIITVAICNAMQYMQINLLNKKLQSKNDELLGTHEKLIQAEKSILLKKITKGIAHDLRNPLSTIKNAAYLIQKKLTKINLIKEDPEFVRYLQMINIKVNISDKILSDLLTLNDKINADLVRLDVNFLIEEALSTLNIPEGIKITKNISSSPKVVLANSMQITQALVNIVLNAYQSMPNGGELRIETKAKKEWVEIIIADTGSGINSQNLETIFEPFFSTKGKILGLGLAISKMIINNHNGEIEVKSELEKGTIFTIRLPKQ